MPKRYTPNDRWSRKAAEEGYRARSVYKLKELDEKFHLIKKGMTVVDLGAAPGSWLQYTTKKVGTSGKVIGVDLKPIESIANVETFVGDITDVAWLKTVLPGTADLVLSDLAPNTSGMKDVDQWRSIELSETVVSVAKEILKPTGRCVMKVLRGADFDEFLRTCKREWKQVKTFVATASRDRSKEIYVVLTAHSSSSR